MGKEIKRIKFRGVCRWLSPLLISLLIMAGGCGKSGEEVKEETPPTDYYSEIRSANKLILAEMTLNKMATVEDLRLNEAKGGREKIDAILNYFKLGTRKGAWSYNTYLRAYIDLSELHPEDVEVDTAAHVMHIRLPEIRTEFVGRDVEIKEDHYRVTGLRSAIKPEERARIKEAMNESLRQEVQQRSGIRERLRQTAMAKAKGYYNIYAAENGFDADITIKGE